MNDHEINTALEALAMQCAYCGADAQGNYAIDRDGPGQGPTVELCDECGGYPVPTLGEIWERIAQKES